MRKLIGGFLLLLGLGLAAWSVYVLLTVPLEADNAPVVAIITATTSMAIGARALAD